MFQGYSDETFEFFMAIRFNNNADFFHANHDWYLRGVREPSLALAEALSSTVEWLDDSLERRPNRVVSRINRDIRFSTDKSPYRDYIWLSFRRPKESRYASEGLGLYFDLSADGANYGMGYYRPERGLMNAFRRRLVCEPERMLDLWTPIRGEFSLYSETYRRMAVPDGLPDALRPLYLTKGFYFEKHLSSFDLLKSPALADEIADGIRRLAPLYHYLAEIVPEEDPDATVERP